MTDATRIGLIGATGLTGGRIAAHLERSGICARLIARRPEALAGSFHAVAPGDLDSPDTLAWAMAGLDVLILVTAESPSQSAQGIAAIEAARTAGVGRIVMLSAFLANPGDAPHFGGQHGRIEQALAASGIDHVILRPSFFMQSLFFLKADIAKGRLIVPVPTGRVAMVELEDVAEVAVRCATGPLPDKRTQVLTGEEAIDFREVAALLSQTLDRRVRHIAPPMWLARLVLRRSQGAYAAANLHFLFSNLEAGREAAPSPDLRNLLGRAPGTLTQFIAREGAGFRADAAGSE